MLVQQPLEVFSTTIKVSRMFLFQQLILSFYSPFHRRQEVCQRKLFWPQTLILKSLYLCNMISETFNILNYGPVRSNILSSKYQRFTPSDCKDKGTTKYEFCSLMCNYWSCYPVTPLA